ncbi:chromo domain-containing protein [Phanerochaete sordida]|uniref:Chromo domain-containing protein n=1 Tax=Phanerochaete sordida TaxID=48140 RepID=A0A9P3GDS6_9APHY|nr:chromo domain-containing protein [Phanerochaete sordida]
MSTSFHPQTDGATERANRSIEQILRAMVKPDQTDWVDKLPMVEFALNSSVNSSTGYAPFELVQGTMPRMVHQLPKENHVPGAKAFVERAVLNLCAAHDAIIDSRIHQTHHANRHRRDENLDRGQEDPLQVGDKVYLSTENLSLPQRRARKLVPKFIGPYTILESDPTTSSYTLQLPPDLSSRGIHPKFHVSKLRRHYANDDLLFPHRETQVYYDMGELEDKEWLVEEINGHRWIGKKIEFQVKWNYGDTTWEPYDSCKDLEALDNYLDQIGVKHWRALPRAIKPKSGNR